MPEQIGERLQAIRKFYGWSQRELAKRAGVANSAISVIEQDSVSPSVASLGKVLNGFPMSLAEFFSLKMEEQTFELIGFSDSTLKGDPDLHVQSTQFPHQTRLQNYRSTHLHSLQEHLVQQDSLLLVTEGDICLQTLRDQAVLKGGNSVRIPPMTLIRVQALSDPASWALVIG